MSFSVTIKNINKSFGDTSILKGITLDVAHGEFVSLVGPSGCGKSTLLRILSGLEKPDSGDILIGDDVVTHVAPSNRNFAMVFQSYALYPHLTVAENIAIPLRMRVLNGWQRLPIIGCILTPKVKQNTIRSKVLEASQKLAIDHLLNRKPGQLSGGQRQRVALARALVRKPNAFLLDEPLSNLDAKLRVHTRAEITQLHRQLNTTFIYVTHDQVEAMTMSNRIAVMMEGQILQCDTPDVLYHNPQDIRVASFIGSPQIILLPISFFGEVDSAQDIQVQVGLRSEYIYIDGGEVNFTARIEHLENLGAEWLVHFTLDGVEKTQIMRIPYKDGLALELGTYIPLGFNVKDALLFNVQGERCDMIQAGRVHAILKQVR